MEKTTCRKNEKNIKKIISIFLLISLLFLLPNCSQGLGDVMKQVNTERYMLVLLDESKSFKDLFEESCRHSAQIVMTLQPGDVFSLQVVDNKAGEDSDVVIAPTGIEKTIMREKQKKSLAEQVLNLKRREGADEKRGTDLMGAMESAAVLMNNWKKQNNNNTGKEMEFIIIVFSDMRPDCFSLEELPSFTFPENTKGYCYYVRVFGNEGRVDNSGAADFKELRDQWSGVWSRINLNVETFSPVSSSKEDISRSFDLK